MFDKVSPLPATGTKGSTPGLRLELFAGSWDTLPDFAALTAESIDTAAAPALPDRYTREYVARRYSGELHIERDGVYSFALTSDDGSRLTIGSKVVIDNDGLHGSKVMLGTAPLAGGWHPIIIEWFNKTGGVDLSLRVGPVGEKLEPIAAEALTHD